MTSFCLFDLACSLLHCPLPRRSPFCFVRELSPLAESGIWKVLRGIAIHFTMSAVSSFALSSTKKKCECVHGHPVCASLPHLIMIGLSGRFLPRDAEAVVSSTDSGSIIGYLLLPVMNTKRDACYQLWIIFHVLSHK